MGSRAAATEVTAATARATPSVSTNEFCHATYGRMALAILPAVPCGSLQRLIGWMGAGR